MADAEIIPLGTRGRPGRGSGRDNPSSSSRALAGRGPRPAPQDPPRPARDEAAESSRPPVEETVDEPLLDAEESVTPAAPARAGEDRPSGLPLAEVVEAVTRAAHVVFGDDAERRLAELLALLRRRVTGDYTVDEYGLDPDVAERLLIETVRPLAFGF